MERIGKLQELLFADDTKQANKLVYEWTKTGVFTKRDFEEYMRMITGHAFAAGQVDGHAAAKRSES